MKTFVICHLSFVIRGLVAVIISVVLLMPLSSSAAILFLKGSDEPLYVLTIRENDKQVVVGVPEGGGKFGERIYEKSTIDDFIRTVSAERLTELSPESPAAYRDYAEELAAKRNDPDARAAAIRLYLIAAHLAPDKLGRSSLLGMTALARWPAEERKFRALSFLLDPKHDRSTLEKAPSAGTGALDASPDEAEQREAMLSALRTLRQGDRRVAERMADRPSVKGGFDRWGRTFTFDEFLAACRSAEALPPETLARILYQELELTGGRVSRAVEAEKGAGWSAVIAGGDTQPVPSLSLKSLTEFDPAKCLYRDGNWVVPE